MKQNQNQNQFYFRVDVKNVETTLIKSSQVKSSVLSIALNSVISVTNQTGILSGVTTGTSRCAIFIRFAPSETIFVAVSIAGVGLVWFGLVWVGFSFDASLEPEIRAQKRARLAGDALAHKVLVSGSSKTDI